MICSQWEVSEIRVASGNIGELLTKFKVTPSRWTHERWLETLRTVRQLLRSPTTLPRLFLQCAISVIFMPCVLLQRVKTFITKVIGIEGLSFEHDLIFPSERDHITVRWRLKSPESRLFTQPFVQKQIKENIKAPRHWLCEGNSPVTHRWPVDSPHKEPVTRNETGKWLHSDYILNWLGSGMGLLPDT